MPLVAVADFGLSRIKDHAQLINSRAGLEGTVEYAAPEVLRGEPYTEKCDIWSYAVLLWELLHRQRPYADTDVPIYILMCVAAWTRCGLRACIGPSLCPSTGAGWGSGANGRVPDSAKTPRESA